MDSKKILGIACLVCLMSLAGCLGTSTYDAPVADVGNETLQDTNYTQSSVENITSERSLYIRNFEVNSYMTNFRSPNNNTAFQVPDSRYSAISTPSVKVFGQQLNPIVADPTDRIFDRVEKRASDSIELKEKQNEFTINHTTAGEVSVEEYNGVIKIKEVSARYDAKILSSLIRTEDAVIVTLASYPVAGENNQRERAISLMKNTTTSQISLD